MTDLQKIRRGDIVFYRPARGKSFKHFPTLAAFAQGFPWRSERPWHHVAICVTSGSPGVAPKVVGFQPTAETEETQFFGAEIVPHDLTVSDDISVDVLRHEAKAEDIASEAERTVGTKYSTTGLVAFALATYARMLPASSTQRARIYDRAVGVNHAVRAKNPDQETCVTAITKVLEAAGIQRPYHEPPTAPEATDLDNAQLAGFLATIREQLDRLGRGLGNLEFVHPELNGLADRLLNERDRPFRERVRRWAGANDYGDRLDYSLRRRHRDMIDDFTHWDRRMMMSRDWQEIARISGGLVEAPGPGVASGPTGTVTAGADLGDIEVIEGSKPPLDESSEYVTFLEEAVERLLVTGLDYESIGASRRSTTLPSDSYLLSPAMLFDALRYADFSVVDPPLDLRATL